MKNTIIEEAVKELEKIPLIDVKIMNDVWNSLKAVPSKKLKSWLTQTLERVWEEGKKETIEKIKYHFETMVFDNTGKDKMVNIMKFRRSQKRVNEKDKMTDSMTPTHEFQQAYGYNQAISNILDIID